MDIKKFVHVEPINHQNRQRISIGIQRTTFDLYINALPTYWIYSYLK